MELAQIRSEDRVLGTAPPSDGEGVVQGGIRPVVAGEVGGRLHHRSAVRAVHIEAEGVEPQRHDHRGCTESDHIGRLFDHEIDKGRERIDADRECRGLVEGRATADLDSHDIVTNHLDPQLFTVQVGEQAVLGFLHGVHPLESDVVAGVDHARRVLQPVRSHGVSPGCQGARGRSRRPAHLRRDRAVDMVQ